MGNQCQRPGPRPFYSKYDFIIRWPMWKRKFLKSVRRIDDERSMGALSDLMLNQMGDVGLDILDHFEPSVNKENLACLLNLFDQYYELVNKRKTSTEDPYDYIKDLRAIAVHAQIKDETSFVLEKLKRGIDTNRFNHAAKHFIPNFSFNRDFILLTFKEIAFIWTYSDECKEISGGRIVNCSYCKNSHAVTACAANGKQSVCDYCGGKHEKGYCPSYDETCRICDRKHHFSWRCQTRRIRNCRYCGSSHWAIRAQCPAINALCTKCRQKGHFEFKCNM